jgi:hypothetical protein
LYNLEEEEPFNWILLYALIIKIDVFKAGKENKRERNKNRK